MRNLSEFLKKADAFASSHIRPFAQKSDVTGKLPDTLLPELCESGYLGAIIPAEYGGLGIDEISYGVLTEMIGAACCSTRALFTVHTSLVASTILRCGTEKQKRKWLPQLSKGKKIACFALTEDGAGSDASEINMSYTKQVDGFMISGKKKWVTYGLISDICLTFAREKNSHAYSAFLIELSNPDIECIPVNNMTVNKATELADIHFNNAFISNESLLSKEGLGFNFVLNTALESGRYSIAWGGIGIARESLDILTREIRGKKTFGKSLYMQGQIQTMAAQARVEFEAARLLCIKAGSLKTQKHSDTSLYINMAKLSGSQIAVRASNSALQIVGGLGFSIDNPAQRLFREAKLLEVIEGTTQIQERLITEEMLSMQSGIPELNTGGEYHE